MNNFTDASHVNVEKGQLAYADMHEISSAFEEFMCTFEEFKSENDTRIKSLEGKAAQDILIDEKLKRLESHMTNLELASKRVPLGSNHVESKSTAFQKYIRSGDTEDLLDLDQKGMTVGSEADGGYLVPDSIETQIHESLLQLSPFRSISGQITISASTLKRPFVISGAASGWVSETEARPETAAPRLTELSIPTMELYACPAASLRLLDDAVVDIEAWIGAELVTAFSTQENAAFINGDGVNMPKGLLAYPQTPATNWAQSSLGFVATGAEGAFLPGAGADSLLESVFSLAAPYRKNARFLMNRMTMAEIRKLKTDDGHYVWQPELNNSISGSLLGYPVEECDDMPDIAPGASAVAFGDFSRGYLIVDRMGVQILRDPYSAKPYVLFYATKRVGGGVNDFKAIRLVKFTA